MSKAVLCMAKTQSQAQFIIHRLLHAGIGSANISVIMSDHSGRYGQEANLPTLLGLLTGIGKIVIPGAGFFLAAGPILTTIHDTPQSTLDGPAGALMHMGLPEYEASRLHDQIKSGAILITFHTPDNDEALRISEILHNTDAEEILVCGEEDLSDTNRYLQFISS